MYKYTDIKTQCPETAFFITERYPLVTDGFASQKANNAEL